SQGSIEGRCAGIAYRMASNSFDHLVGADEQRRRHVEAERLRGLEIDHKLELGRLLNRQVAGILPLEDTIYVTGRLPGLFGWVDAIRYQAAAGDEETKSISSGKAIPACHRSKNLVRTHQMGARTANRTAMC